MGPFHASLQDGPRNVRGTDYHLFSYVATGGGGIDYADVTGGGAGYSFITHMRVTPNAVIYSHEYENPKNVWRRLLGLPLGGGAATLLSDDNDFYSEFDTCIGNRVVYHRCPTGTQPCDVLSVNADGTNRVVLASQPANEAVQGIVGNQVLIRRNLAGNDQLVAVPVAGGAEKPLMTMTDNEFVDLIVGDLIIVRRQSGHLESGPQQDTD